MQNVFNKQGVSDSRDRTEDYISSVVRDGEQKMRDIFSDAQKKISQSREQLKKAIITVDKQLHKNPWPIVSSVAAACLLLGFILGQARHND